MSQVASYVFNAPKHILGLCNSTGIHFPICHYYFLLHRIHFLPKMFSQDEITFSRILEKFTKS